MNDRQAIKLVLAWHGNVELSADERALLLAALREDGEFRREIADRVSMEGLVQVVQAPEARWLRLEDRLELPRKSQAAVEERVMNALESNATEKLRPAVVGEARRRAYLLSSLVVLASLAFVALGRSGVKEHVPLSGTTACGNAVADQDDPIAIVTQVRYPLFAADDEPLTVGQKMRPGRIRFLGGAAEITIRNGVKIILEGPSELELVDELSGYLHSGSAVVRMPEGMDGYRLGTASTDIIDLGTEFAVRVMPDMSTDVQVYDGAVVAACNDGMANKRLPQRLEVGQAARFSPTTETGIEAIPFLEERFVRQIEPTGIVSQQESAPADRNRDQRRLFGAPRNEEIVITKRDLPVTIDGVLGEWPAPSGFSVSLHEGPGCVERVDGWMMYDDDNLYIAAEVRDPSPLRNVFDPRFDAFAAWRGGGLQVRLSTDRVRGWPVSANGPVFYADKPGLAASREALVAAKNPKLSHLSLWFHAPTQTPCLAVAHGMYVDRLDVNPPGFIGGFQRHDDGQGYTVEYAISWDLLNCEADRPQPGDILATAWQAHFSDSSGRLWRDQIVDIRNQAVDPRRYIWGQAETWGRAVFR